MAIIDGTPGNDFLNGTIFDDIINGFDGNDTLFGGSGNDQLNGGNGNDLLNGGGEADHMDGGDGSDTYVVDNPFDVAAETFNGSFGGVDLVESSSASYVLGFGIEYLTLTSLTAITGIGNEDNNFIDGNNANNVLNGLDGNDRLRGLSGNDTLLGGSGNDTLLGGDGDDALIGGDGNDILSESLGNGNDELIGSAGDDTLFGAIGDDFLDGGAGVDNMNGGDGSDTYIVDNVDDVAAETSNDVPGGVDTVQSSVSHTLGFGIEDVILTGVAAINGTGNENNNVITGNGANNVLSGLDGDDTLNGGTGADTASYETATAGVMVSLLLVGTQNTIGAGIDTLSNIENLQGSNFSDTLTGDAKSNILIGGLGNDILNGAGATDTVSYETATAGVTVSLLVVGAQNTVNAGTDTLSNFENIRGSSFNDTLTGNGGTNILTGGLGDDVLNGDAGSDTASYETSAAGVTVSLAIAGAQNTIGAGTDTLSNFENLRGSNFNDTLTGNAASNVLIGHLGNDVLDGGAGTDTASYETATSGVTVSLAIAGAQNTIGAGTDTLLNFEHLRGGVGNDTLTGNTGSNILTGGLGNDVLDGGAGTDTASYDTAFGGVTVNLGLAGAQNTVNAGTDTLSNFENLKGSIHNDTLTGNAASNVIIGDQGNDIMNGDAGIDIASYETAKVGVTVSLAIAGAQNTIGAGTDTLTNFEQLRGSNFNDTFTGDTGANSLFGGLGNDTMTGNAGPDSFVFNSGLNATTNTDTITDFSVVDDTLVLENAIFTQFAATGAIPAGTFVANAGAVAGDANDFLLYDTNTGKLFYDADGNGAGAKVEFVTLVGIPTLTSADFSVI